MNYEKEILLHPRNVNHLLMPLTDEIFVKDIYQELLDKGVIKPVDSKLFSAFLPSVNVKNSVVFVGGKQGVASVALRITNSATNQADTLELNKEYNDNEGAPRSSKLLFKGLENNYRVDNYVDSKGTVISEILSQLLTTQVDNVKNPTAVLMNINMQTLSVLNYLIARGVSARSAVLLLNQPLIKKYLQYQKINESQFNKNAGTEEGKKDLIKRLLKDNKYSATDLPNVYEVVEGEDMFVITDKDMIDNAINETFDANQLKYLAYFTDELQSQSAAFGDFQTTQNSDTKGLKDKQMLDETKIAADRTLASELVPADEQFRINTRGVISPFYQYGRQRYSIYNPFYALESSKFKDVLYNFKNKAASIAKSADKDRVRQTIENDFMLFLIHNFEFTKQEFDRLMKGDESVAKRVLDLKELLPSNLVLKAFFPMLNNSTDKVDKEKVDNLRIFEKELNSLDSNDLRLSLEEIADTNMDLYNDIVKLLMFQTGLNISPFNYRAVIPVGLDKNRNEFNEYQYLYQDILKSAITKMRQQVKSVEMAEKLFKKFEILFAANNSKFLRKNFRHPDYPYPLVKAWLRDKKETILKPQKGNEQQIELGNSYMKQYFTSLINTKLLSETKPKEPVKPLFNEDAEVKNEDIPYTDYEDVTNEKEGLLYELYTTQELHPSDRFTHSNLQETLSKLLQIQNKNKNNTYYLKTINSLIFVTKRLIELDTKDVVNPKVLALPESIKETINIYFGSNENRELSNLATRHFTDKDGRRYYSVEHAYQSWKSGEFDVETYKRYKSGGVKLTGNKGTKTENNWNLDLMKRLIKTSLEQNPKVLEMLLSTGNTELTHTQEKGLWGTEFPRILMELRNEMKITSKQGDLFNIGNIEDYEVMAQLDNSKSTYTPSLKIYEGFIQLNQLYTGDEILPFIGESEYYRYLVPMLLNMNPEVKTIVSNNLQKAMFAEGIRQDTTVDFALSIANLKIKRSARGLSNNTLNANFIKNTAQERTIVHELVHRTLQKEYDKRGEFYDKILDLYDETVSKFPPNSANDIYGLKDPKEFLAEALANPEFMQTLNNIPYSEETVWSYLMTLISDFINGMLNIELKSDSVLAEVVRVSEQVLQNNMREISKETKVELSTIGQEIVTNWNNYFPQYSWMNLDQKLMTAKLVEEGKITLNCEI